MEIKIYRFNLQGISIEEWLLCSADSLFSRQALNSGQLFSLLLFFSFQLLLNYSQTQLYLFKTNIIYFIFKDHNKKYYLIVNRYCNYV